MKLNQNSISARIYRWFYMTNTMPKSLCPYFWKLVVAYILFIPWSIISLPTRVFHIEADNGAERFITSIFGWSVTCVLLCMIFSVTAFWGFYDEKTFLGGIQRTGICSFLAISSVSLIFGIIHLVKCIQDKKRENHKQFIWDNFGNYIKNPAYVEPRPNIIKEFIKAKYNKYCPKIDWN
jgi:hypothetical protein